MIESIFFLQFFGGVSYGVASYRRKATPYHVSSGWYSYDDVEYDDDTYNYIGVPLVLTLNFTRKMLGFEISIFENFHKHPETGISINFILGKFR